MRIASDLGGFTLAEADLMRRAMGKKKKEVMAEQKKKFVDGCTKKGIDKKVAQQVADLIEKFASYGFNKSHSAAYAIIAYQTAYLKAHYPAEFMSANLTTEMHNGDRVMVLMDECKKIGLKVKPPDVNYSVAEFEPVSADEIAFGMEAIKNVGRNAINSIVQAREEFGPAKTIFDLLKNVDLRLVNKKVMESLIQAGALDSLEGTRAQLFHSIESATAFAQSIQGEKNKNRNQRSLFDLGGSDGQADQLVSVPELPDVPEWNVTDKLKKEKELLGFYISGHPLERYRPVIRLFSTPIDDYLSEEGQEPNTKQPPQTLQVSGQIIELRTILDKKNQKMAFVKIEDFRHTYEVVVFGSVYPSFQPFLQQDQMVMIFGKLSSGSNFDDSVIKMIGDRILPLEKVPEELTESIHFRIQKDHFPEETIHRLKTVLRSSPGTSRVFFEIALNGSGSFRLISNAVRIRLTFNTLTELDKLFGEKGFKVKVRER